MDFYVTGLPLPKGSGSRSRPKGKGGRLGRYVESADAPTKTRMRGGLTRWCETVAWRARAEGAREIDGAVEVELWFYLPRERSTGMLRGDLPIQHGTGDVDKLARGVFDALEKICWTNDARVTDLISRKRFADGREPGCWVRFVPMTLEESE